MYIKENNTYNKFNAYLCFHKHKYHLLKIQSECNTYYKINCLMAYNTSIFQTNYTIIALFNSYIKATKNVSYVNILAIMPIFLQEKFLIEYF